MRERFSDVVCNFLRLGEATVVAGAIWLPVDGPVNTYGKYGSDPAPANNPHTLVVSADSLNHFPYESQQQEGGQPQGECTYEELNNLGRINYEAIRKNKNLGRGYIASVLAADGDPAFNFVEGNIKDICPNGILNIDVFEATRPQEPQIVPIEQIQVQVPTEVPQVPTEVPPTQESLPPEGSQNTQPLQNPPAGETGNAGIAPSASNNTDQNARNHDQGGSNSFGNTENTAGDIVKTVGRVAGVATAVSMVTVAVFAFLRREDISYVNQGDGLTPEEKIKLIPMRDTQTNEMVYFEPGQKIDSKRYKMPAEIEARTGVTHEKWVEVGRVSHSDWLDRLGIVQDANGGVYQEPQIYADYLSRHYTPQHLLARCNSALEAREFYIRLCHKARTKPEKSQLDFYDREIAITAVIYREWQFNPRRAIGWARYLYEHTIGRERSKDYVETDPSGGIDTRTPEQRSIGRNQFHKDHANWIEQRGK